MIRAGVLENEVEVPAAAECPSCQGSGEVVVARLFGRSAPEPYVMRDCSACGGSGQVDAEAVTYCDSCGTACWSDEVCRHGADDALCADCRPAGCRECVDEARERAGEYR